MEASVSPLRSLSVNRALLHEGPEAHPRPSLVLRILPANLDCNLCLALAVQETAFNPFDHRCFQPDPYILYLLCGPLNDYIVASEDLPGPGTLVPLLPQK